MADRGGTVLLAGLMVLAVGVFTWGINWGLPSAAADEFLFGDRPAWTGSQIIALIGHQTDSARGADVDANPTAAGSILNATDSQRAEIVRRYRLFTFQPDENVTLMALAAMKPGEGDFDPRLYQYGGLWIYPVGALLKVCLNPRSQEYYLDHPGEFGRFYVVARLYVVFWGLVGVWAVFRIATGCGAGLVGAGAAALLYIVVPVVVNMSHEAKPHLPGAVLILLAAMSAGKFVESGRARWGLLSGILCGMSAGMVLTGALAFVMLPVMGLMRPMQWSRRIAVISGAVAVGVVVYFAANPYVFVHLVGDHAVLESNLSNSRAMYEMGKLAQGLVNAARLVWEGATPTVLAAGLIGVALIARPGARPQTATLRLLLVVSAVFLLQFIALAAGKPGEYGRFALVPVITLCLCVAAMIGRANIRTFEKLEAAGLVVVLALLPSAVYLYGFARDSGENPRRMDVARQLDRLLSAGALTLGLERDPAPYRLGPVNLFRWAIIKLPEDFDLFRSDALTDVVVRPVDVMPRDPAASRAYVRINGRDFEDVFPARISWANKPLEIWVRRELLVQ
jgi:hypothetical protein